MESQDLTRFIHKQLSWFKGSFDNTVGGASGKKLAAFGSFIIASIISFVWTGWALYTGEWDLLPYVLGSWLTTLCVALGINASEKKKGLFTENPSMKKEEKKIETPE